MLHIYGKIGVLHIYGTFFYRKYATPKRFSQQNWQMWVSFSQLDSHFFWDISKLPNLKALGKTSTNKIPREHKNGFSVIMQRSSSGGVAYLRKLLYNNVHDPKRYEASTEEELIGDI